jgi:hypothetical protein
MNFRKDLQPSCEKTLPAARCPRTYLRDLSLDSSSTYCATPWISTPEPASRTTRPIFLFLGPYPKLVTLQKVIRFGYPGHTFRKSVGPFFRTRPRVWAKPRPRLSRSSVVERGHRRIGRQDWMPPINVSIWGGIEASQCREHRCPNSPALKLINHSRTIEHKE